MLYELSIAQLLGVVVGGTLLQYSLTIGLFTLALGLASLVYERIPAFLRSRAGFVSVQIATVCAAAVSALSLVFLFRLESQVPPAILWLAYLPPFLIGLLTGLELPLLLEGFGSKGRAACLGADYFGMFAATLAFPLFLLPSLGPLGACAIGASLNTAVALIAFFSPEERA